MSRGKGGHGVGVRLWWNPYLGTCRQPYPGEGARYDGGGDETYVRMSDRGVVSIVYTSDGVTTMKTTTTVYVWFYLGKR